VALKREVVDELNVLAFSLPVLGVVMFSVIINATALGRVIHNFQ